MKDQLVEDLCNGILGVFHHKEPSPGQEFRFVIFYKPAGFMGLFSKPKKLPAAVPPDGILEVAGSKCSDGYPRMIIWSYGNDDIYPPLIPSLLKSKHGEIIKKMEDMSLNIEERREAMESEKRVFDRSKEAEIEKVGKMAKGLSQRDKPKRGGFLDIEEAD